MYWGGSKRKNAGNTEFREPGKTWADLVGDDAITAHEERNSRTVLRTTIEQNEPINDNRAQGHETETEEGETISDPMRIRMNDGSDGMDIMKTDGHNPPDTA
jgi:hypothetical protein